MKNKLNVVSTKYNVIPEKGLVVCMIECDVQLCKNNSVWIISEYNWWRNKLPQVRYDGKFTVRAKAKCCSSDIFDSVKGKRIAESRAKAKAYGVASRFWNILEGKILEAANFCDSRTEACIEAQRKEAEHVITLCK